MDDTTRSNKVHTLLDETLSALGHILALETMLREKIVATLGVEPKWWKRRVPGTVRAQAEERRNRDRESPYATTLSYHQVYYCYLDDLRQTVTSAINRSAFSEHNENDLKPRFEELLALRNRAAHGRLLTQLEAQRVKRLVEELSILLTLTELPADLSYEDPQALKIAARDYLVSTLDRLNRRDTPLSPVALKKFSESPVAASGIQNSLEGPLEALIIWLEKLGTLEGRRNYKLVLAREFKQANTDGVLRFVHTLIDILSQ